MAQAERYGRTGGMSTPRRREHPAWRRLKEAQSKVGREEDAEWKVKRAKGKSHSVYRTHTPCYVLNRIVRRTASTCWNVILLYGSALINFRNKFRIIFDSFACKWDWTYKNRMRLKIERVVDVSRKKNSYRNTFEFFKLFVYLLIISRGEEYKCVQLWSMICM